MGRDLHLWWISLLTGLGFALVALLCALLSFFITGSQGAMSSSVAAIAANASSTAAAAAAAAAAPSISLGWGWVLMAFAQASGVMAWFVSVKLGVLAEASAFLPIISLYTMGTSLLAVPLLGEQNLPALYWVGVACATAGILLIAYSDGKPEGGLQLQDPPLAQDADSAVASPSPMLAQAQRTD